MSGKSQELTDTESVDGAPCSAQQRNTSEAQARNPRTISYTSLPATQESPQFGSPITASGSRPAVYSNISQQPADTFETMFTPSRGVPSMQEAQAAAAQSRIYVQQVPPQPPVPPAPSPSPSPSSGLSLGTTLQILQIGVILVGASIAYGVQREQIEQLKTSLQELKADHIAKEIYNERLKEQERTNKRIEDKVDRIDSLLHGLYDKVQVKEK